MNRGWRARCSPPPFVCTPDLAFRTAAWLARLAYNVAVLHRAGPSALTLTLGRTVVLLLAVTCACTPGHVTPAAAPGAKPNILLVTIDTLRADRLGRGFTPTLGWRPRA